jgi:DNA (cytosine-5)-methyltransferase 1
MGRQDAESETLIPTGGCFDALAFDPQQITSKTNRSRPQPVAPTMANQPAIAFGWQNSSSQGDSASEQVTPTLDKSKTPAVAVDCYNGAIDGDTTLTLRKGNGNENGGVPAMLQGMAVRRLTPRECERLQGFPHDYTLIPGAKDGPRYKALGNSMAVPVMAWIGRRIAEVDALEIPQERAT